MHEMGIAAEVYRISRAALPAETAGRLEEVSVVVGELSAVEPDLLKFAWEALVAGGPDEGARLTVEWRPARQECDGCGTIPERAPGTWLRLCPRCGDPLRVMGGDELDVARVSFLEEELENEGEATCPKST
jgi:hydrogenase nickel incorporation protein HypA/HybF